MSSSIENIRWISTSLDSITEFVIGGDWGKDPIEKLPADYVQVACIRGSEYKNWRKEKGAKAAIRQIKQSSLEKRQLRKGDILLEISGGGPDQPVGRTVIVDDEALKISPALPKICSNFMRLLRLKDMVDKRFINYYLYQFYISGEVINYQGGSNNLRNLKFKEYAAIEIPLAPLIEQQKIADILDTLFLHHDNLNERLDKIPVLLKQFRERILNQAVTGELTKEWREENVQIENAEKLLIRIQSFRESWANSETTNATREAKKISSKLPNHKFELPQKKIPNTWAYSSLLNSCLLVIDCHNKTAPYEDKGIYLVRTSNIKKGKIIFDNIRYVSPKTYEFWSKRCNPSSGDIIFTREAPIGEAAIIPKDTKICLGQRTMLFRPAEELLSSKYILYSLLSPEMINQVNGKAIGSGVKHLRVGDVESLVIAIPPLKEQEEIIKRVDALFSSIDKIEKYYLELKSQIQQLPQNILEKAFSGTLVKQDGKDEPASALLERIFKRKNAKDK